MSEVFPAGFVPEAFTRGNVLAIVGHEPAGDRLDGPLRWHISVSARGRVPSWEELVRAAHDLRPGVCFTLGLPPKSWWLNAHPDVLHLWETDDPWLIEEYRINGRGDEPS